jgi:hypothetical protein
MTWRIELAATNDDVPVVTVIKAQAIWKRLSKTAQAAVVDAYPDGPIRSYAQTVSSLYRHGFIEWTDADPASRTGYYLTEAGKAVAKWCVPHG